MDTLLKLLRDDASLKPAQLAAMLNLPEAEVVGKIKALEADGIILGYRAVLNEEKLADESVREAACVIVPDAAITPVVCRTE